MVQKLDLTNIFIQFPVLYLPTYFIRINIASDYGINRGIAENHFQ
jgi:hypothetical protein